MLREDCYLLSQTGQPRRRDVVCCPSLVLPEADLQVRKRVQICIWEVTDSRTHWLGTEEVTSGSQSKPRKGEVWSHSCGHLQLSARGPLGNWDPPQCWAVPPTHCVPSIHFPGIPPSILGGARCASARTEAHRQSGLPTNKLCMKGKCWGSGPTTRRHVPRLPAHAGGGLRALEQRSSKCALHLSRPSSSRQLRVALERVKCGSCR